MGNDREMTMLQHLEELRRVMIISVAATLVMALGCWFVSDTILPYLLKPVTDTGSKMVYIGVTEALFTKIKLSLFLGFLAALPVILWQFWGFIIPALHKKEKIYFTVFVLTSYLLFAAGLAFGFFLVFHLGVRYLIQFGGPELTPMLTIGKYISFAITFLLPFGLVFEIPLASLCLAGLGVLSYRRMARGRKTAVVIAVVIACALIPSPDIVTVLLMAAPMYFLYEISACLVRFVEWRRSGRSALKAMRNFAGGKLAALQSAGRRLYGAGR
ncbi:MAG: twin-arginine translocase subunit TatC [Firmicutes bacterium]|nr:twin-arginine translocase subunit TatC [Bacillota bacterium]